MDNTNNVIKFITLIRITRAFLMQNFLRTLKMPLHNCEVNLILTWSINFVISKGNRLTTFSIKDTKLYLPIVTFLTQDATKLLKYLKSGLTHTINYNNRNQH